MGILYSFKRRIYESYYAIALKHLGILRINLGIWHVTTLVTQTLKKSKKLNLIPLPSPVKKTAANQTTQLN